MIIASNTVISPNVLVWKFCGKANRVKLFENCVFPENFDTRKLGEITVSYVVGLTSLIVIALKAHLGLCKMINFLAKIAKG